MFKLSLIIVGCIISNIASAQKWRPVLDKRRAWANAAAVRYKKTTESAPKAARLAILSCEAEKKSNFGSCQTGRKPQFCRRLRRYVGA